MALDDTTELGFLSLQSHVLHLDIDIKLASREHCARCRPDLSKSQIFPFHQTGAIVMEQAVHGGKQMMLMIRMRVEPDSEKYSVVASIPPFS